MRITERDLNVLVSLSKYRFLTLKQIQRLHFPNRVKAQQRLRQLFDSGYIGLWYRPALTPRGKSEFVYYLKKKALGIMSEFINKNSIRHIENMLPTKQPRTLNHILDINTVGISIELAIGNINTLTDTEIRDRHQFSRFIGYL